MVNENYIIRKLETEETDVALSLVWKVFSEFEAPDYSDDGVAEFRRSVWDEDYLKQLVFYGAFYGDTLVGTLATRSSSTHIALFFVDGEYQSHGIGTALFEAAVLDCNADKITVNSSPFAVPVYHALGFTDTDSEQVQNGVRYTPMVCVLRDSDCPCKRTKCERHGNCLACREHHKTEKKTPVSCERIRLKAERKTERTERRNRK